MTRIERIDFLIGKLIQEGPQDQGVEPLIKFPLRRGKRIGGCSLPADEQEKWNLLRSLMNVRPPGPVSDEFLQVQDTLLTELTEEKGIVDVSTLPAIPGEPKLMLWQGDITTLKIDAIVNAANSAMLGCFQPCHNCIDNAIHTYAGIQLRNECDALMREQGHQGAVALHPNSPAVAAGEGREPTGKAKITRGYNLPAGQVLHTVGPIISGFTVTKEDDRLLAGCYRSCLELAVQHNLESIAFCCISTGVFRFPKERAAKIAVNTVRGYLALNHQIKKVVFNVFTEEDCAAYQRILG